MIIKLLVFIAIYFITGFAWHFGEKLWYGTPNPRKIDDVVHIILTISIYYNIY